MGQEQDRLLSSNRKGRTRFNDVKVKHGRGINPCDKHAEVWLLLGAFKSWLGFFLPEGLCFGRESPGLGGVNGLCSAGGQERGTRRSLLALKTQELMRPVAELHPY